MQPLEDGSKYMFERFKKMTGTALLWMVGTSCVYPRTTFHPPPASLLRMVPQWGLILWASQAFQGSSANEESKKQVGGWRRVMLEYSLDLLPVRLPIGGCVPEVIAPVRWTSLAHPSFLGSKVHLDPHPFSLGVLCYPCGPFPSLCPHLSKCPFIKLSCNHPNLNVPSISYWNTIDIDGHEVYACWFSGHSPELQLATCSPCYAPQRKGCFSQCAYWHHLGLNVCIWASAPYKKAICWLIHSLCSPSLLPPLSSEL